MALRYSCLLKYDICLPHRGPLPERKQRIPSARCDSVARRECQIFGTHQLRVIPKKLKAGLRTQSRQTRSALCRTVASDADGDLLGGMGTAIELRSRLQDIDLEMRNGGGSGPRKWEQIEGAWVRLPAGRAWGCVHFIGGAVLGSFPHIVYDTFLGRLCDEGGLMVVATPYELSPDHGSIAAETTTMAAKALAAHTWFTGGAVHHTP
ncbi:hypothetical protein CYMTET_24585 [Cymbomonas tetramitiformis]|uniref:Uncharacterized protein n=1 Tax=Cymbomonas tetramitiformis TaxID=36881 RepID=A0AAE0KZS3_9CHLO|nr:hypothetical protein CYMTET_24585 [Cymbomonas tetramitiformis]